MIDVPEKVTATNSQQISSISFITVNGYIFLDPRELAHGCTSPLKVGGVENGHSSPFCDFRSTGWRLPTCFVGSTHAWQKIHCPSVPLAGMITTMLVLELKKLTTLHSRLLLLCNRATAQEFCAAFWA